MGYMSHPKKFLNSFKYAANGLRIVLTERNFRIQTVAGAIALVLMAFLPLSTTDRSIIILCIAVVLGGEAMNSATERLLDYVSTEHREEIRQIKDLMAAAVLIFSVAALIIGATIFGNAFFVR
jgi:undecaprenol kinase